MKKRNQLLALCALVILVLTVFACENPFIPGKYKEPAPPQAPSVSVDVTPIGPYVKGEGLTITAKASVGDGGDLSYQWYSNTKNSSSGGTAVSGATGESYRPSTDMSSENILEPCISYYYVKATNTLNGRTTSASSRTIDVAVFDIPIGTTPIREVNLTLTPPVKDGIPATLEGVTSTGSGYTVQAVAWTPIHNTFMSGGKYTIWVTLQADAGYTFIALRTATINGQAAAVENNNGNTLYLTYEFKQVDVRVVTSIAIKTQPNELTYGHEDTLRLQGLVVTLTYDSGDPEDVAFTNFASRTIATSPTHGITLSHTTHHNTPVVVSCNGHSVNTNNLIVNKAQITTAFVGIEPPAKENIPVTVATVAGSDGFTAGTVTWSPNDNPFEGNKEYTATVTLAAKADYEFASGMTAHINSSPVISPNGSITNNSDGTRTITFKFDRTLSGTVLSIAVTRQPDNLTYTHGDILDLTGLEVTVQLENSNPEVLTFSNASLFQTVPANGFVMRHAAYDGQPITVNYSGHNAHTNNLTVNKKALTLDTSAASHTKVYNGNTDANNIGGITLVGVVSPDNVYIEPGQVNGVYTSANVPTNTVNITSIILNGSQSGNYTVTYKNDVTLTGTGNVGITKANPTVTWPSGPFTGNYGSALSTVAISGGSATGVNGAAVSGNFSWTTQTDLVGDAGPRTHSMTFTPDSGNYNTRTGNVSVTVINKPVTLTVSSVSRTISVIDPATFTVTVNGMVSGHTVTINVGSLSTYGLSVSNNTITSGGSATLTLTYNGTTAIATASALPLTISADYYTLTGSPVVNATYLDGQTAARAMAVTQENITRFNTYAQTTNGLTRHYYLKEDITLTVPSLGGSNWTPIGYSQSSGNFSGSFDGRYHTITNLTIYASDNVVGMFGYATGVIKNLGLVNVKNLYPYTGNAIVGGLVGFYYGSVIENCFVTGSVGSNSNGVSSVGGLIGSHNSASAGGGVTNCYSTASVTGNSSNGSSYDGGLIGWFSSGRVESCYVTGAVSGKMHVGGLVGTTGNVNKCVALNSSITTCANNNQYVGRIMTSNTIYDVTNYGKTTGITMRYNTSTTYTPVSSATGKDGVDTGAWNTSAFWSSTVGWDMTNFWQWSSSLQRPVLRGFATQP